MAACIFLLMEFEDEQKYQLIAGLIYQLLKITAGIVLLLGVVIGMMTC